MSEQGYTRHERTRPVPDLPSLKDGKLRSGLDYSFDDNFGALPVCCTTRAGICFVVVAPVLPHVRATLTCLCGMQFHRTYGKRAGLAGGCM